MSDRKTLGQVLKETANREAATVKYDVKVRFDGRDYSLIIGTEGDSE